MSRFQLNPAQEVELAEKLSRLVHKDQVDKQGKPYIGHVEGVVEQLHGDEDKTVGWLHDVVEDGNVQTDALIRMGFSLSTVGSVNAITRRKLVDGQYVESYQDYIRRLKDIDERATRVKIADLRNNIGRLHELAQVNELKAASLQKRYLWAFEFLTGQPGL